MAATTSAIVAAPSTFQRQLSAAQNGVCGSSSRLTPAKVTVAPKKRQSEKRQSVAVRAASAPAYVPDMGKRTTVNLLLLGAVGLPGLSLAGGYAYFFVPPGSGSSGGGIVAKDAFGNDVSAKAWVASHPSGDRTLVQGLKGDPTYLIVEADGGLANYGVNAVCTHLGCVVPWNSAENQFQCPCHGSRYNNQGRVVRGPAPLSLALAHADVGEDKVILSTWTETDFRTGDAPWWS